MKAVITDMTQICHEILRIIFPQETDILSDFAPENPVEQRMYLIHGQLCLWAGPGV